MGLGQLITSSGGVFAYLALLPYVLGLWIVYQCVQVIYNLCLSPLAKFPGPKLAAATAWYETYFSLIHEGGGRYFLKIAEWHSIYGALILIPLLCLKHS